MYTLDWTDPWAMSAKPIPTVAVQQSMTGSWNASYGGIGSMTKNFEFITNATAVGWA